MSRIWWWPSVGVTAMIVLGLAVGKRSTPLDDWFQDSGRSPIRILHYLANPLVLAALAMMVVVTALYRRWWLFSLVTAVFPPAAYLLVQAIKPFFGRVKGSGLAYPSGHLTMTTVVVGLCVLVLGGAMWAVLTAAVYVALAMLGVGSTFHYFTDTVGGVLLGTSIVCVAAIVAGRDLTRVNPLRSRSHAVATMGL